MALIQSQISAWRVATGVVRSGVSHAARRRSAARTRDSVATPLSGGASPAPRTIVMAVSGTMVRGAPAPTSGVLPRGTLGIEDTTQKHAETSQTRYSPAV